LVLIYIFYISLFVWVSIGVVIMVVWVLFVGYFVTVGLVLCETYVSRSLRGVGYLSNL